MDYHEYQQYLLRVEDWHYKRLSTLPVTLRSNCDVQPVQLALSINFILHVNQSHLILKLNYQMVEVPRFCARGARCMGHFLGLNGGKKNWRMGGSVLPPSYMMHSNEYHMKCVIVILS